jgi:hypothetical protein
MTTSTAPSVEPDLHRLSRHCWGALEVIQAVGWLAPQPAAAYAEHGLRGRVGYFAARSAPMGAVGAGVVTATFYVFAPSLVAHAIPKAWERISPAEMVALRYQVVTQTLREVLGSDDDDRIGAAARLARTACEALEMPGRPLYAAHSLLPWPEDPVGALYHAAVLLREHRGDGHVAALVQAGLGPVDALVLDGLFSGSTEFVRTTRGWTDEDWVAAQDRLTADGRIDGDRLTQAGVVMRKRLERATDDAAMPGWTHLGIDGCHELLGLLSPLRERALASGVLPVWIGRRGGGQSG